MAGALPVDAVDLDAVRFDPATGLVPAVLQDVATGEVLTVAYANREALERTQATAETWLWSRSRGELWHKGATSGHTQTVRGVRLDCDGDAVVLLVDPSGPACHTGARSCFAGPLPGFGRPGALARTIAERAAAPDAAGSDAADPDAADPDAADPDAADPDAAGSYTAALLAGGPDRVGKKLGEEATELALAVQRRVLDPASGGGDVAHEAADLLYHALVALQLAAVPWAAVLDELGRRAGGDVPAPAP